MLCVYAPVNVKPHLPQVGQRWGLVGICKVELLNAPPLGTMLLDKSPANPHITRRGLVGELTLKIFRTDLSSTTRMASYLEYTGDSIKKHQTL